MGARFSTIAWACQPGGGKAFFFEKKQKPFSILAASGPTARIQINKSLFVSFSSEKEGLSFL
jgi:hypothetical protein